MYDYLFRNISDVFRALGVEANVTLLDAGAEVFNASVAEPEKLIKTRLYLQVYERFKQAQREKVWDDLALFNDTFQIIKDARAFAEGISTLKLEANVGENRYFFQEAQPLNSKWDHLGWRKTDLNARRKQYKIVNIPKNTTLDNGGSIALFRPICQQSTMNTIASLKRIKKYDDRANEYTQSLGVSEHEVRSNA